MSKRASDRTTDSADTEATLGFVLGLHRVAAPDAGRSACWSPYSVLAALGLAATAAGGSTREQLLTVLGAAGGIPGKASLAALARLCCRAADLDPAEAQLLVTSTAWLREDIELADGFAAELQRWPLAGLRTFGTDLRAARERINADVAETTRGLIRELIGEGVLTAQTVAVLVSALYLKTAWLHPFEPKSTRPRQFHATSAGTVEVPTMEVVADLGYTHTDRWQVVLLAAQGGVEALILLPHSPLADVEPALTAAELGEITAAVRSRRLRLRLPRLRVEWGAQLSSPLAALGITELFDPKAADLTGLTPARPTWVDEIVHRAVLRVDEAGLEGAAATAVVVALRALVTPPPEPLLVEVNRPFLLLIRHRETGLPYFLARVTDPS